jgi:ABC-2 type transport system permease protein
MDWNQLRTILWLRWRLTRNQWSRGSPINAVLAVIAAVLMVVAGLSFTVFGFVAGLFPLSHRPAMVVLGVWDAVIGIFLFLWALGLMAEIQRSEAIDTNRMLHLPISVKQVFFINYLASHLTLSVLMVVPAMLGLSLGLILGRGWLMIGLLPLFVGCVFMVTAWTYCLRGWLVALMTNPRRRRTIMAAMAFIAVAVAQLPNLLHLAGNRMSHSQIATKTAQPGELPRPWRIAHQVVPFLWVGNGAMALAQGNALPALWGAAASFGIGALGLTRACRSTLRFYQGGMKDKAIRKAKTQPHQVVASRFVERQLPGIPEEATATALATLRSLTRAPEVKMALAMNVFFLVIFGASVLFKRSFSTSHAAKPFIATGVVVFLCFSMLQLLFNQFGYDRAGFRALVLSPAPRRWILLGKNLALLPVFLCVGGLLLILLKFAMAVPSTVILVLQRYNRLQ